MARHLKTPNDIAEITGYSLEAVGRWLMDRSATHFRPIPEKAWAKILEAVGEV
jgi:hypothetical protein